MDQMSVNIENGGAIVFGMNDVVVPEFVVQRASHAVFLGNPRFYAASLEGLVELSDKMKTPADVAARRA
jgi:hypothetical protein